MSLPILYSLRQCPYAMRARMGLLLAKQEVILRDIVMKNIPSEIFAVSAKGEVPVLVVEELLVIDESLDIMVWALKKNDPNNLLLNHDEDAFKNMLDLINYNDNDFVDVLKKYKAASRYHDSEEILHREQCEIFIADLEQRLIQDTYLMGPTLSLVDYAILPFIRQFSRVDRKWFVNSPYNELRHWLESHYQDPIFSRMMTKFPQWLETKEEILFN